MVQTRSQQIGEPHRVSPKASGTDAPNHQGAPAIVLYTRTQGKIATAIDDGPYDVNYLGNNLNKAD